jgi:hypothetical protein
MSRSQLPVLIIGGSGVVGAQAAATLRKLHPDLPIIIGGRDLARAQKTAHGLGNAAAAVVDLTRRDLGLKATPLGAIALFVKDHTLNSMRYALDHKVPYVDLSSGTFEIGPGAALYIHHPDRAPVLMASHWLAGAAVFPALQLAAAYETVSAIRIGVVLDEEDMGGPAAAADYERLTTVAPSVLTIQNGETHWVTGDEAMAVVRSVDGALLAAQAYSPFDVLSLHAATAAQAIRFDFVYGQSASRRHGQPFSTETIVDITGTRKDGTEGISHLEIVHPKGQAPLTALGVALGIEALLGLKGEAPAPGLYLPETLIDPDYFVAQMKAFGAVFSPSNEGGR